MALELKLENGGLFEKKCDNHSTASLRYDMEKDYYLKKVALGTEMRARSALNAEKKAMERGIINVTLRVKQLEEEEKDLMEMKNLCDDAKLTRAKLARMITLRHVWLDRCRAKQESFPENNE
ncbi:unnamed protein product [Nippostrongylus brasiliensis]|uniref:NAM-associated domain-containing protein n=1 Tax=Nippostrongylus brasiliensis TaxID=27835 RepID=A0A0N4YHD2_NIPBR|nr:unnamed protein product [Nippostrongylus brasiliensis]